MSNEEKQQKTSEEKSVFVFKFFIGLILLIGIIYIWNFTFNFSYVVYNSELNKVCNDYGYEKATDSRFVYYREYSGEESYILIECDNEVIKNKNYNLWMPEWFEIKVIGETWCDSVDKWGDCNSHDSNKTTIILH